MLKVVALLALAALAQANEAQYIKNKVETFVETIAHPADLALESDVKNYTGTSR